MAEEIFAGSPSAAVEILNLAKDDSDATVRLAVRQALTVLQS